MGKLQSHNIMDVLLAKANGDMSIVESAIKKALMSSEDGRIDINTVISFIKDSNKQADQLRKE